MSDPAREQSSTVARSTRRFPQVVVGLIAVAVGIAAGGGAIGDGFKARNVTHEITVTGSARRAVVSDSVTWSGSISSTQPTTAAAIAELDGWSTQVRTALLGAGATSSELTVSSITTIAQHEIAPSGT